LRLLGGKAQGTNANVQQRLLQIPDTVTGAGNKTLVEARPKITKAQEGCQFIKNYSFATTTIRQAKGL
jgi:hypothetical protein